VEVAGVLEDVPVRLGPVHGAVGLAVEVQRPRLAAVDDFEFLVGGLGLVNDLTLRGDAHGAAARGGDQQDGDADAGQRLVPVDPGADERDGGADREQAEDEPDDVDVEGRDEDEGSGERADDAP